MLREIVHYTPENTVQRSIELLIKASVRLKGRLMSEGWVGSQVVSDIGNEMGYTTMVFEGSPGNLTVKGWKDAQSWEEAEDRFQILSYETYIFPERNKREKEKEELDHGEQSSAGVNPGRRYEDCHAASSGSEVWPQYQYQPGRG